MFKKIDEFLMQNFPYIIMAFTVFWLGLVAIGWYLS